MESRTVLKLFTNEFIFSTSLSTSRETVIVTGLLLTPFAVSVSPPTSPVKVLLLELIVVPLLPDPIETLKATEILVREGFVVLPYINADPVLAKRLQEAGAATVMPLGSPIGSNRGILTRDQIRIIIEQATVPVVVDAGLGAPSHAAEAMEMGADAVLVNTAIAVAADPSLMAVAFQRAVQAGRMAFEAGMVEASLEASPTSPLTAFLDHP